MLEIYKLATHTTTLLLFKTRQINNYSMYAAISRNKEELITPAIILLELSVKLSNYLEVLSQILHLFLTYGQINAIGNVYLPCTVTIIRVIMTDVPQ